MPRDIKIAIVGDASNFKKALDDSDVSLSRFASKVQDAGESMMKVGAKMSAAVTLPVVALGKLAFDAASDLNESVNKVGVVFGDWAIDIEQFAQSAATNLGISRQAALEAAGTFGNLFSALGLGKAEMTEMSTRLVALASDLASFNNVDPAEVLLALRSGLVGEVEPLRKFGVSLSQARIEAEALQMGLVSGVANADKVVNATQSLEKAQIAAAKALKANGAASLEYRTAAQNVTDAENTLSGAVAGKVPALNAAQKAQAAYSIVMKDTAVAQGDFARTADGAANKQRILKAQFEDAAATIGTKLLPVGMRLLEWAQKMIAAFDGLSPQMQDVVLIAAAVAAAIGPLVTVVGGLVAAVGFLISPVGIVVLALAALAAGAVYAYNNFEGFRAAVDKVVAWFQSNLPKLGAWFSDLLATFNDTGLSGAMSKISDDVATAWPGIRAALVDLGRKVLAWVGDQIPPLLKKLGEWGQAFLDWVGPRIPPLVEEIGKLIGKMLDWLLDPGLPLLVKALVKFGKAFGEWIGPAIPPMLEELGKLTVQLLGWIVTEALPRLTEQLGEWTVAFVKWIPPAIPGMLEELGKLTVKLLGWIVTDALPTITEKLGEWTVAFVKWVVPAIARLPEKLGELLASIRNWITGEALPRIVETLGEWTVAFLGWVADAVSKIPGKLEDLAGVILGWIGKMPERIASVAVGMWDGIKDAFRAVLNWIITAWNSLEFTLPSIDLPGGKSFGGQTIGVPKIDPISSGSVNTGNLNFVGLAFATGGMVPGPLGLPQLAVVHGGEQVLTPQQQKQQGGNTNSWAVYQTITAPDPLAAAEAAIRGIRRVSLLRR